MKLLKHSVVFLFVIVFSVNSYASGYYISSSLGNDLNDGKTTKTPWQSISKLQSVLNILQPGDSVLFKAGDTFPGQLILSKSGNSNQNIFFGSYGTGEKPVISGTTTVSDWEETSFRIWEATCIDCGTKVTNFFIDRKPQQIGRWPNATDPNKGYLSYESHSGTNQITDNQLSNATDWTGAEAVVRRVRWILDRLKIKSQNNGTLQFSTNVSYEFIDGFGYFIQNDPRTLDQQGEWYYNPAAKKFSLYSETDPNQSVTSASKLDVLLKINGLHDITVENIVFNGSVEQTIDMRNCSDITFKNIEVNYSGENAVNFYASKNILFESNLINHTNNNAFTQQACKNVVIQNNTIKNTALIAGMGLGADGQYNAMQFDGTNILVEFNDIDSVGYIGMNFNGDSVTIKNNVISNYAITKDDAGGLYTWSNGKINYNRKLIGNIVMNAIGAPEGSGWPGLAAEGIYIDDRSANVDIIGNTVFKCGDNGIMIHNANHINIRNNVSFDNGNQFLMVHDNIAPDFPITNCTVDSNLFVAKEATQGVASFKTVDNGISELGDFNENFYCRPLDDKLTFNIKYVDDTTINKSISLGEWQTEFQKDLHSGKSPVEVDAWKILGVKSSNYFRNSTFAYNISNWNNWANYGNSKIELARGEGITGNALKASFTGNSGQTDGYQLVTSNSFSFTEGKFYRIKFEAKGSRSGASVKLIPRKNGGPWNNVAVPKSFMLSTFYKQYEFLLEATTTESNSRIDFEIREGQGDVWFDDLVLEEVDIKKTDPDDYIRFEYNTTTEEKVINLTENYIDVTGNPVSPSIHLKPFTSVVLLKNMPSSTGYLIKDTNSKINIFPNPATDYFTLKSKETILSVRIYNINGQMIKDIINSGSGECKINNLPAPGTYIVKVRTDAKSENKKLIISN